MIGVTSLTSGVETSFIYVGAEVLVNISMLEWYSTELLICACLLSVYICLKHALIKEVWVSVSLAAFRLCSNFYRMINSFVPNDLLISTRITD